MNVNRIMITVSSSLFAVAAALTLYLGVRTAELRYYGSSALCVSLMVMYLAVYRWGPKRRMRRRS